MDLRVHFPGIFPAEIKAAEALVHALNLKRVRFLVKTGPDSVPSEFYTAYTIAEAGNNPKEQSQETQTQSFLHSESHTATLSGTQGIDNPGPDISAKPGFLLKHLLALDSQDVFVLFESRLQAFAHETITYLEGFAGLLKKSMESGIDRSFLEIERTKYMHLFSSAPEGIVMLDGENRVLEVNPEFERMFGYSSAELLGQRLDELIAPKGMIVEAREFTRRNWMGKQVAADSRRKRRDGTLLDVSILGVPFDDQFGAKRIFGIYRDISNRVNSEKQQRDRIAFIEYISRLSSDLINMEAGQVDHAIEEALERIGVLVNAERAYIVGLSGDERTILITHEWACDPRYAHGLRQPGIRIEEIGSYFDLLKSGRNTVLHRDSIAGEPEFSYLAFYLDMLEIESLVNIPLFADKSFIGYIGADTYSRPARWDEQTLNNLRLAGQIIANALSRKDREEKLSAALARAESSDRLKSAFLAGISHEVRTPMNHIMGFMNLLNEPDLVREERQEYISIMKSSGKQLLRIIDEVIELAMLDAGQVMLKENPCHISRFLESLYAEFREIIAESRKPDLNITSDIPDVFAGKVIVTDEVKLRHILWNLLSNAVKFTSAGSIRFGARMIAESRLEFYVSDTGIGIDPCYHSEIFERFHRLDSSLSSRFGGTGLGLPVSQRLASLFGSRIHVESTPGKGSLFTFSIPYLLYAEQPAAGKGALLPDSGSRLKDKTILMVEDDLVNLRFLTAILMKTGAELLHAANGEDAVRLVGCNNIDLVLMDMQLPVMDGYEATRRIKAISPDLPVIAQTAQVLTGDRDNCLSAGCDDYIPKPIDKNLLYTKISSLILPEENKGF